MLVEGSGEIALLSSGTQLGINHQDEYMGNSIETV